MARPTPLWLNFVKNRNLRGKHKRTSLRTKIISRKLEPSGYCHGFVLVGASYFRTKGEMYKKTKKGMFWIRNSCWWGEALLADISHFSNVFSYKAIVILFTSIVFHRIRANTFRYWNWFHRPIFDLRRWAKGIFPRMPQSVAAAYSPLRRNDYINFLYSKD